MINIEIIKSKIGNSEIYSVNARKLHETLEVKKKYSDWIKYQIKRGFFEEDIDYICISQKRETQRKDGQNGISVSTEYFLTLDTAKEIAMMSGTQKGKYVRNYFIEVEKQFGKNREIKIKPKINLSKIIQDSKYVLELIHLFEKESPINLIKLDRFMKKSQNFSPLELLEMDFSNSYFIPTELGNILGKTPFEINRLLGEKGFQFKENGVWKVTEKGEPFAIFFQNGSYFQIKWKLEVLV